MEAGSPTWSVYYQYIWAAGGAAAAPRLPGAPRTRPAPSPGHRGGVRSWEAQGIQDHTTRGSPCTVPATQLQQLARHSQCWDHVHRGAGGTMPRDASYSD